MKIQEFELFLSDMEIELRGGELLSLVSVEQLRRFDKVSRDVMSTRSSSTLCAIHLQSRTRFG
jgi:hypothetical protein